MSGQIVTELALVRHGETEWNSQRRCQGHLDITLSELGQAQSRAVAETLARQKWDALYSSDLARASGTAGAIAEATGLTIHSDERLRERSLGVLQGLTHEEFHARYPEEFRAFYGDDPDWVIPGGESQRQASDRVVEACLDITAAHPGERVIVVTHGGCIGYMLKWVMGLPCHAPRKWSIFNCGVHTFNVRGDDWRMVNWGDVSHLDRLIAMDGVSL